MSEKIYCLLLPFLLLLVSCNNTACYDKTKVTVNCGLYSQETNKLVSVAKVTVKGIGSDSIIYNNISLNEFSLELNPNTNETKFVVMVTAESVYYLDTLTFIHTNRPWFQSMECGCMTFSTLDTCLTTGRIFKSVEITEHEVTNLAIEHVKLKI